MNIDAIHKALSHPVRREILDWLKAPDMYFSLQEHSLELGVCASLIDDRTGLSQSTVSAHLSKLVQAGLVKSTRVAQWIFFKRDEAVISAFKAHIRSAL